MSLVGTRPILQDELRQYELHHRARIAIKPGITGMWQVSGRSDITDFEEVVRLDTEYISKYMSKQIQRAKSIYKKDMIFMYAWNEWAEGGYLEPDERTGYKNLEAIRDALKANNEFPW